MIRQVEFQKRHGETWLRSPAAIDQVLGLAIYDLILEARKNIDYLGLFGVRYV